MYSQIYKPEAKLNSYEKKLIEEAESAAKIRADSLNQIHSLGRRYLPTASTEDCVSLAADLEVYGHDLGFMVKKGSSFWIMDCENAKIPTSLVTSKLIPLKNDQVITLIGRKERYPVRIKRLI